MTSQLDELIENLKSTTLDETQSSTTTINNKEKILKLLNDISTYETNQFEKTDLTECLQKLLQSDNIEIIKETGKCIAEITKTEKQRKFFTKLNIIIILIDLLKKLKNNNDNDNIEMIIQICRALGNICYLNDDARMIILNQKGDEILINLLTIDITTSIIKNNENDDIEKIQNNNLQFIKVRGGLISNYLLGGEQLAKRAMDLNIIDKIQNILNKSIENVEQNEDLLLNTLPILSILTENVADLNFDSILNIQLAKILAGSTNPDLAEMCLELLHYQAENDDVKLLLAKNGLCETIYKLLETYKTLANTSEARALMKLSCDLIVLILTGDESMHYLYSTPLLKNMEDWLDSYDVDLLTTGVLALGNFARTDSHCIYMVENKIMNKLLEILSKNNGVDDDMRLQHALLSALRNLVIPKPNKGAVIEAGLVQTILPMLEIHQPPVVFKLLGTLRMTVDGQEKLALDLLQNKTLIEQLVHWSKSSDYAGVTGESLRLMAWLIKHAYLSKTSITTNPITTTTNNCCNNSSSSSSNNSSNNSSSSLSPQRKQLDETSLCEFVKTDGSVESMINMLTSQHLVMQNEALIALSILTVVFLYKTNDTTIITSNNTDNNIQLDDVFIKYDMGKKLSEFITRSSDNMTKEIVENLQKFNTLLKKSDKLVQHLEENNITELLKSIPILTEYCTL